MRALQMTSLDHFGELIDELEELLHRLVIRLCFVNEHPVIPARTNRHDPIHTGKDAIFVATYACSP